MKNLCRVIIISLIFIFLLVNSSFAVLAGANAWKIVKLMNRYTDADPVFSVSANRLSLFKNSVGYLSGYKTFAYYREIVLSANQAEYVYPITSFILLEVHAIRRVTAGNVRSLTSINVGDVNKVSKVSSGYPEYYYLWKNGIGFAPPPAVICTMSVYAYWRQPSVAITTENTEALFNPAYNHVLYFYLSSLYKEREGNMVAASNLRQIANSMLYDMFQIFQMAEQSVDIKIAPEIYEE